MKKYLLSAFAIALLFVSCTETVDVDLNDAPARLVIEASLDWEKGTTGANQTILLSTSTEYFNETRFNPALGATEQLTKQNSGTVFSFADQGNGSYTINDFEPEIGATYVLEVLFDGKTYRAEETLLAVPEIDRVEQSTEGGFDSDAIDVRFYFTDPEGENYYLAKYVATDNPVPTLETRDVEFSEGNELYFQFEPDDDNELQPGDVIDFNLHGISERYYNYMTLLTEQAEGGVGPFQTTPVPLKGNCININDNSDNALGYFRVTELSTTSYTVE